MSCQCNDEAAMKRTGLKKPSTLYLQVRAIAEELESWHAMAEYLGESTSDMVRRLLEGERRRLLDAGKRPPMRRRGLNGPAAE